MLIIWFFLAALLYTAHTYRTGHEKNVFLQVSCHTQTSGLYTGTVCNSADLQIYPENICLNLQDPTQFLAIFNTRVRPYIKNISILLQLSRIDLICHAISRETHIHFLKKPLHCAALGVLANSEMEASFFLYINKLVDIDFCYQYPVSGTLISAN